MRTTILGIPIDAVSRHEAVARIGTFLDEPRGHLVTTPNPEMLVLASKNARFKEVLSSADLSVADGIGLVYASRLYHHRLPERVTGTDLVSDVAALAARRGRSVYLLGGQDPQVASDAASALRSAHRGLRVVGAAGGGKVNRDHAGVPYIGEDAMDAIRAAQPDILFVAFGHGKQEEWIAAHLASLPSVRIAMGIGGAFDFIAGRIGRAPMLFRVSGMEWLWRLIVEPWRAKRIATAVLTFPYLVVRERIGRIKR